MALTIASLVGSALAVAFFFFLSASFGSKLIRLTGVSLGSAMKELLAAAAIGVIGLQVLIFLASASGHLRLGLAIAFVLAVLLGHADIAPVFGKVFSGWRQISTAPRGEKFLAGAAALVAALECLSAMAPLTASDALHYHFTFPALLIRDGFHPNFFLTSSFLSGQSHLLILLGLALGSERLASALISLGGLLTAAAAASLARYWMNRQWAWLVALLFLLTPLVFWQIASPGAPDIWMSFFAIMGVIVISESMPLTSVGTAIVAGVLAGGIAGAKYTGCFVAVSLALAVILEFRSVYKTFVFGLAALAAGVWPYLRNLLWTGDPVFPFLAARLSRGTMNSYALMSYLANTGEDKSRHVLQIVKFALFSAIDHRRPGFFQFFGPLALAFIPLTLLAVRNTRVWRTSLLVWFVSAVGMGVSSGIVRFLLPIFPVALAASVAGAAAFGRERSRMVRAASIATLAATILAGAAGLVIYVRKNVEVAVGLTSRENYLRANAPDYQAAEFVNQFLQGHPGPGKALVFFRHVYFLHVPFLYGDPTASWAVDPSALRTPAQWEAFLQLNGIKWIVRSPDYPPAIASVLETMESDGDFAPATETTVDNFSGKRILGIRERTPVVILRVRDPR